MTPEPGAETPGGGATVTGSTVPTAPGEKTPAVGGANVGRLIGLKAVVVGFGDPVVNEKAATVENGTGTETATAIVGLKAIVDGFSVVLEAVVVVTTGAIILGLPGRVVKGNNVGPVPKTGGTVGTPPVAGVVVPASDGGESTTAATVGGLPGSVVTGNRVGAVPKTGGGPVEAAVSMIGVGVGSGRGAIVPGVPVGIWRTF